MSSTNLSNSSGVSLRSPPRLRASFGVVDMSKSRVELEDSEGKPDEVSEMEGEERE